MPNHTHAPSPATPPVRVGVIGLGMMGTTHLDVYSQRDDVEVVAISSRSEEKLKGGGKGSGNIKGMAQGGFDFASASARGYTDWRDLIADPDVQAVDICTPTPLHLDMAREALAAGKHTLIEKPIGRTAAESHAIALMGEDAWERHGAVSMAAMCMRFWPGWDWLKQHVDAGTYGRVKAATFRRVCEHTGAAFNLDGDASGGGILDLHIHDADFVQWCFGKPHAVSTVGYTDITGQPDHVSTQYHYGDGGPALITAEGGWVMQKGFGFSMRYCANFERATAVFDLDADPVLRVIENGESKPIELAGSLGYENELAYWLDRIQTGRRPETVTLQDAADAVTLIEAEHASLNRGGQPTRL